MQTAKSSSKLKAKQANANMAKRNKTFCNINTAIYPYIYIVNSYGQNERYVLLYTDLYFMNKHEEVINDSVYDLENLWPAVLHFHLYIF